MVEIEVISLYRLMLCNNDCLVVVYWYPDNEWLEDITVVVVEFYTYWIKVLMPLVRVMTWRELLPLQQNINLL
jgi:hypothetical protein